MFFFVRVKYVDRSQDTQSRQEISDKTKNVAIFSSMFVVFFFSLVFIVVAAAVCYFFFVGSLSFISSTSSSHTEFRIFNNNSHS